MLSLEFIAQRMGGEISANQVKCPGPGHSPRDRSLSIKIEPSAPGGLIVYSHAQDDNLKCKDWVFRKLGMQPFRIRPNNGSTNGAAASPSKIVKAYDYKDADGKLLYQVVRYEPKDFRHRQPDGKGGWIYKGAERRVLYRLADLMKYPDATVFVCEGEKDADRVASLGYCATTVASGKWTADCISALRGRDVVILADNDETGRKKAEDAAVALMVSARAFASSSFRDWLTARTLAIGSISRPTPKKNCSALLLRRRRGGRRKTSTAPWCKAARSSPETTSRPTI